MHAGEEYRVSLERVQHYHWRERIEPPPVRRILESTVRGRWTDVEFRRVHRMSLFAHRRVVGLHMPDRRCLIHALHHRQHQSSRLASGPAFYATRGRTGPPARPHAAGAPDCGSPPGGGAAEARGRATRPPAHRARATAAPGPAAAATPGPAQRPQRRRASEHQQLSSQGREKQHNVNNVIYVIVPHCLTYVMTVSK